ncbi:unnamed protein product [Aphanomyces euteiches]|uniref:Uncharacterized protein n=1 Tax=Aphanomyces euteiches TaxID=100861 RepID=A0A6G0W5F6_9STRA|nr:hypothetical protein Ae201684_019215 [Aphanomyces euteiches]KAH9078679.1 hypothetical protein Ae201684P_019754 [Aphanomyces euteiches]KAH9149014.1 hypothetical protein AeRB84_007794 [Aphanomyces euteiches]
MFRPGQKVQVQGLLSSKEHNGKVGVVKVALPIHNPERIRVKLHGMKQLMSVRPTNLVAHGPIPSPQLREAVLADLNSGEIPMHLSVETLRGAMCPHDSLNNPLFAHRCVVMCGRCGIQDNTNFMARVPTSRREVRLECVECVVFLVAEAGIDANDSAGISAFVERRYMGSIEAAWKLAGYSVAHTFDAITGIDIEYG